MNLLMKKLEDINMNMGNLIKKLGVFSTLLISCLVFGACGNSDDGTDSDNSGNKAYVATQEIKQYTESEPDKFYYEEIEGGLSITGYMEEVDILNVPESINGIAVTDLADSAFYATSIKEVNLPDTIISIGENCFAACDKLEKINLGNSVQKIENCAIFMCSSLREIVIPESVTDIGNMSFAVNDNLVKVEFNANTEIIPGNAFADTKIKKFVVSESVKTIEQNAFNGCNNLTEIEIPSSVTSIDDKAFKEGTQITIVGENGSYAGEYANKHGYMFVEK